MTIRAIEESPDSIYVDSAYSSHRVQFIKRSDGYYSIYGFSDTPFEFVLSAIMHMEDLGKRVCFPSDQARI